MAKRDVRERKCGCLFFQVGPPVLCPKHTRKTKLKEVKSVRRAVEEQAAELDHELGRWSEYTTPRGKWVAHCVKCGLICIVYDDPPPVGDQIAGWALSRKCNNSRVATSSDFKPLVADTPDEFEVEAEEEVKEEAHGQVE